MGKEIITALEKKTSSHGSAARKSGALIPLNLDGYLIQR